MERYALYLIGGSVLAFGASTSVYAKAGDAAPIAGAADPAAPAAGELDLFKAKNGDKTNHELRIVEIEFKENLWQ